MAGEEGIILNSVVVFGALFLRWAVALNSYSGENKPPMYGDYEAQRHWMEITYNLPIKEWYTNSSRNDLMYWGLDYPPLTAYHSWICGYIANYLNPKWVELGTSRGFESYEHKLFMRYTVVFADALVYMSAVFVYAHTCTPTASKISKSLVWGLILTYPGLILIDHGHFQYNCVSLGLTLWAIICLFHNKDILGAAFFSLALNYKQMELYHAFPFFFYLAGRCWQERSWYARIKKLTMIGLTVIAIFTLCWLPFLTDKSSALQVLHRIFPFARGLYEDKVANFWCCISIVIKVKDILSQQRILQLCSATTLVACMPSCINLFLKPSFFRFLFSLVNCSLSFFLFSFQVHEKSILIVALPVCLLLPYYPLPCLWFLVISCFSMYPLLERDGQAISYFALVIIFIIMTYLILDMYNYYSKSVNYCFMLCLFVPLGIHVSTAVFNPPAGLPDLAAVIFAIFSCGSFVGGWIVTNIIEIKT
eukprot:gene8061-8924_t